MTLTQRMLLPLSTPDRPKSAAILSSVNSGRGAKASRTEWAAVFLAAAELVRKGYVISFTMGNRTPMADLMVGNPISGKVFWIDVKGIAGHNGGWSARAKTPLPDLFYILVSVANDDRASDKFFVLSQDELNKLVDDWRAAHPNGSKRGEGISWKVAQPHENKWRILPDYRLLHSK